MGLFKKKRKDPSKINQVDERLQVQNKAGHHVDTSAAGRSAVMRTKLGWRGKLIGDQELEKLVIMDTKFKTVQKRITNRLIISGMMVVLGVVAGALVQAIMHKPWYLGVGLGVVLAGVMWFMDIQKTSNYYRGFQLRRQVAFAQFTRLAAAYLPELKNNANLYTIFNNILPRLEVETDRNALRRLMVEMQVDPRDQTPWLDFAHTFSVSDRAELIMLSIQQMYLGDVDDQNIRSLADDANEDMKRQIDNVIAIKMQKFQNVITKLAMIAMLIVFGYLAAMIWDAFQSMFGTMRQANVSMFSMWHWW